MTLPIINIPNEYRACECCGSDALEGLWTYSCSKPQRSAVYEFSVSNVICRDCGFVFVSPCFNSEYLARYYDDFWDIGPVDYSIERRLSLVSRYALEGGTFLEIGAKQTSDFHTQLSNHFDTIITQDVSSSGSLNWKELGDLPTDVANVAALYYVLEHITNVREFLSEIREKIRVGGNLIIEVPDLAMYPDDTISLIHWEHTNHFSVGTLTQIAQSVGFRWVETSSSEKSRSFGVVVVFEKTEKHDEQFQSINEYDVNKRLFNAGLARLDDDRKRFEESKAILAAWVADGRKVIVWGVNDDFLSLHEAGAITDDLCVIDIDPRKSSLVSGINVKTPTMASEQIMAADAILICARTFSDQILSEIKSDFNKSITEDFVRLI